MTELFPRILVVLLYRTNWRKLLFVSSVFTLGSIMIQISSLPYPLPKLIFVKSPSSGSLPQIHLNPAVHLTQPLAVRDQLEIVRDPHIQISLNASAKVKQSIITSTKEEKEARQRRKRSQRKSIKLTPPYFPTTVSAPPLTDLERYVSSLTPDEALAFAKIKIHNASFVNADDRELYAPLFRDISTFKRSYEWMEKLLKVYIYRDGERPIFHKPQLTGIYSSEGWFMKLMEGNTQFVTKDPDKANLFYLPYSARQLQLALYVPNSHDLRPLSIFLRNYINMLASKYPFWNRTHGADHFLVACHDWGPLTLNEHEELSRNTIKVLCNADVSVKFIAGKDVSLPETIVEFIRRPIRNMGGNKVSQRPILAFFAGRMHGRVRPELLKYWSNKDKDMKIYGLLPNKKSKVMSYPKHMKSSKYCICPMGFEVNSPRIVEAIYYECVPVIIADNFVPPFSDVLEWDAFSVTVAEKDIPKLKEILLTIPMEKYVIMQRNVKMLQKHFVWHAKPIPYDLFHMILHSIWSSRLNQIQIDRYHHHLKAPF